MPFSLYDIILRDLDVAHIQALLDAGRLELKQLEYKRELPPSQSELRELRKLGQYKDTDPIAEFAADVSAMANSDGGDIIFGVDEESLQLSPLRIDDWDATRVRLEQLILTSIEPQIVGFDFQLINTADKDYVVVLRVPRSLVGPHRITKAKKDFFMRHPGGKHPMDITQIRASFLSSAQAIEKARSWREERFEKLQNNKGQLQMEQGPVQVLHLIPLRFTDPTHTFDVRTLAEQKELLVPVPRSGSVTPRYNADGVLTFRQIYGRQGANGYVQFHRQGQIEAVRIVRDNEAQEKVFPAALFEEELLKSLAFYVTAMHRTGVSLPILVGLAFFNVASYRLAGKNFADVSGEYDRYSITPNVIWYRDVLLTDWIKPAEMPAYFRDLIESLWNASGHPASHHYDEKGNHEMSKVLAELPELSPVAKQRQCPGKN